IAAAVEGGEVLSCVAGAANVLFSDGSAARTLIFGSVFANLYSVTRDQSPLAFAVVVATAVVLSSTVTCANGAAVPAKTEGPLGETRAIFSAAPWLILFLRSAELASVAFGLSSAALLAARLGFATDRAAVSL